jgi:hypothetical protein
MDVAKAMAEKMGDKSKSKGKDSSPGEGGGGTWSQLSSMLGVPSKDRAKFKFLLKDFLDEGDDE